MSGLPGVVDGQPFMSDVWATLGTGSSVVEIGTPLLFDLGVFLAVIGVVLTIVFTLVEVILTEN